MKVFIQIGRIHHMTKYCKDQCIICIFSAPQKYFESKLVYSRMIIKTHARVNLASIILHESYNQNQCLELNFIPIKNFYLVSELIFDLGINNNAWLELSNGSQITWDKEGSRSPENVRSRRQPPPDLQWRVWDFIGFT